MKIVILLIALCILLFLYLFWSLYKYVVALLYYLSLSNEDAEYMINEFYCLYFIYDFRIFSF